MTVRLTWLTVKYAIATSIAIVGVISACPLAWGNTSEGPSCAILVSDSSAMHSPRFWQEALQSFRDYAAHRHLLRCMESSESVELLHSYHEQVKSEEIYRSIDQGIDRAKEHWFNFEFEEALAVVNQSIALVEGQSRAAVSKTFIPLGEKKVHALLVKALILQALDRQEELTQTFEAALAIHPKLEIDALEFPPSYRTLFNEVKRVHYAGPVGSAVVTSSPPAASVYVNGINYGHTPLPIDQIPAGTYELALAIDHYGIARQRLVVEGNQTIEKQISLIWEKQPSPPALPNPIAPLLLKGSKSGDEELLALFQEALAKNKALKSDKIVLLRAVPPLLEIQVLDSATKVSHKPLSVPFSDLYHRGRFDWQILENALHASVHEELLARPNDKLSPRTSELVALRRTAAKPFYRRPLFWIGVGGAVVGGTVGGILLSSSGGSGASAPGGTVEIDLEDF